MSLYLDTRGKASAAVAICARCHFKKPLSDLIADPNANGLRVCGTCADEFDPWRLPARKTEDIALQYPRPEEPLAPP